MTNKNQERDIFLTYIRSYARVNCFDDIVIFTRVLLIARSTTRSFRSVTVQVPCITRNVNSPGRRKIADKSPRGSSRNFHFDFPRALLSFIKIDALKAVRGSLTAEPRAFAINPSSRLSLPVSGSGVKRTQRGARRGTSRSRSTSQSDFNVSLKERKRERKRRVGENEKREREKAKKR